MRASNYMRVDCVAISQGLPIEPYKQDANSKPSWECPMERMEYIPSTANSIGIARELEASKQELSKNKTIVRIAKKLYNVMMAEVQSAVEAVHKGVLRESAEEMLKDIFVVVVQNANTGLKHTSSQFVEHGLLHMTKRDTLHTNLVQNFEKLFCSITI